MPLQAFSNRKKKNLTERRKHFVRMQVFYSEYTSKIAEYDSKFTPNKIQIHV